VRQSVEAGEIRAIDFNHCAVDARLDPVSLIQDLPKWAISVAIPAVPSLHRAAPPADHFGNVSALRTGLSDQSIGGGSGGSPFAAKRAPRQIVLAIELRATPISDWPV